MRHVPPVGATGDPELRQLDWMVGSWTAQPREFPSNMRDPAAAERSPTRRRAVFESAVWSKRGEWLSLFNGNLALPSPAPV
jgi:hypothetical protein